MKPNASRPDGPTSLPASAGACDPRPYMGKARRDATRASEEYMRRVRSVLVQHRAEELKLLKRLLKENGWA